MSNEKKSFELRDDPGFCSEEYLLKRIDNLDNYKKLREGLSKFINDELIKEVDYGQATGQSGAKPTILKPGIEKICQFLGLEAIFVPDLKTWEMYVSDGSDRVCYICYLMSPDGKRHAVDAITSTGVDYAPYILSAFAVGEGRACGNLNEKKNSTDNDIVKRTQKRAQADAVLRVGGISEFFTQDMEEGLYSEDPSPGSSTDLDLDTDAELATSEDVGFTGEESLDELADN